jgi:hypothetical protein
MLLFFDPLPKLSEIVLEAHKREGLSTNELFFLLKVSTAASQPVCVAPF